MLISCATQGRKERSLLRENYKSESYEAALKALENPSIKEDKNSILLYFLEKGQIYFRMGEDELALASFEEAEKIFKEQFTISLSKKALTWLASDKSDLYYGRPFERSMNYLYLVLSSINLAQKSKENKKKYLPIARSYVLQWDSFFQELKRKTAGINTYKEELLLKLVGSFVHLNLENSKDEKIALLLLKDARKVLKQQYRRYQRYNRKFLLYQQHFHELHLLKEKEIEEKYVEETENYQKVVTFIEEMIKSFDKKTILNNPKKLLVVLRGLIPLRLPKKYNIGLESAFQKSDSKGKAILKGVAISTISVFAATTLGLVPSPNASNALPGTYLGLTTAQLAVENAGISFELPHVETNLHFQSLVAYAKNYPDKKINFVLTSPLDEFFQHTVIEEAESLYWKVGTRLALKHLAAIMTSYATYQFLKQSSGDFMAKNAALLQYLALSKAIESSEQADLRQWGTLPKLVEVAIVEKQDGLVLEGAEKKIDLSGETEGLLKYPILPLFF